MLVNTLKVLSYIGGKLLEFAGFVLNIIVELVVEVIWETICSIFLG